MKDLEIATHPYRMQGLNALTRGEKMRGKLFANFEEAHKAASVQASNQTNLDSGNKFVVYRAVAIVGPPAPQPKPKLETTMIDPDDPNLEGRN